VALAGVLNFGLIPGAQAGSSAGCDWPMYQHDQAHSGAASCSTLGVLNVATLHPAWFASTAGAVTAEPTVSHGTVYVGDSAGVFHALDAATGAVDWTFSVTSPQSCFLDQPDPYVDRHSPGFGSITSSASESTVTDRQGNPLVFFGGGGSLFALDSVTGRCVWAQDVDPGSPTNVVEVESSPVVDTSVNPPEVIVGSDDNSGAGSGVTGIQAFNASTGALRWRYEPERDVTLRPSEFGGNDALTLSCGDGSPNAYCAPAHIPGIGENSKSWADACGDVWSSASLDSNFVDPAGRNSYQSAGTAASTDPVWVPKRITATGRSTRDGLLVFGTGNCGANPDPATTYAHDDYAHTEGVFALDPVTGVRVWNWFEPANLYNTGSPQEGGAGDTDFGGSSILASVPRADFPSAAADPCPVQGGDTNLIIQGGKSGFAYALCEDTGKKVWSVQAAQPGQLSPEVIGAIGGFIGTPSLGQAGGRPTAFFDAALPLPFTDDGVREPGDGDDTGATCPGVAGQRLPLLPACPDPSLATNPARLLSVSAIDAATGDVVWRTASSPSYAATTYAGGVVFAPSTTTFSYVAYDADNGLPLWRFPSAAAVASGASVVGSQVFVGAGLSEQQTGATTVPPGLNGVWSFGLGDSPPGISGLP